MEKLATRPRAPERSGPAPPGRAASPRAPYASGHLGPTPADPLAAMAGYLRAGPAGEMLGADGGTTRARQGDGARALAAVQGAAPPAMLHRGPIADAILGGLGARGASAGSHLFLRSDLAGEARAGVLRHERAHAAQAGGRMPDLGQPLRLGGAGSALERDADAATHNLRLPASPLHADPNLVQLDRCPGGCHTANEPDLKLKDWEPLEFVGKGVKVKTPAEEMASQPRKLDEEIEGYEQNILATRSGIFDRIEKDRTPPPPSPFGFTGMAALGTPRLSVQGTLPPDLKQRYAAAITAASVVQVAIDASEKPFASVVGVPIEAGDEARLAINAYYLALEEFAAAVDTAQVDRHARMRAAKDEEARLLRLKAPPCPNCHSQVESPRSFLPDPPPLSAAPLQLKRELPKQLLRLKTAGEIAEWKAVQSDLKGAINAMDSLLIDILPEYSEEADTLRYLKTQKVALEKLKEEHPGAKPIPAVFYPKNRWTTVDVPEAQGYTVQIPQAIPWRFYLYHSSERGSAIGAPGEWTLVDLTAPKAPPLTWPTWSAEDVKRGPPLELFKPLNTKYRFPEGKLHWTYPDGTPGELATTEPAEVSDWLGWIGLALAAIALIAGTILTLGLATPITAPALGLILVGAGIGSAGFGIASTVTGMNEKERYGLLTEDDKNRAILSIALDIIGALSLGLGRLALAAEAGARAAQIGTKVSTLTRTLALLNGRYFFLITRSANVMKGVGLAADATQLLTTTADFIKAFNAIRAQPGLSDADRDAALIKLVSTSLLTGTLLTVSVRSTVREMRGGVVRMTGVDPDGTVVVSHESGAPASKAGAPDVAAPRALQSHLDTGTGEVKPGWSRKAKGPQVDPALPEGKVEVRIVHDESGRIVDAETFHHAGADADSIAIHEDIAKLVRSEGEELRNIVHQQRSAFGGDPPPLELQLELKKLFAEMAAAEKKLASGALKKKQAEEVAHKLKLLQHEIDNAKLAMADPSLRSAYPPGVVGVPVKPTALPKKGAGGELVKPPGFPDPPAGHMYYLRDDGKWGLTTKAGYAGSARFDVEEIEGRLIASNRAHVQSDFGGRNLTPRRQELLESLGYVFQKNGVVRRPPGHGTAGRPSMVPIEVDAHGRVQIVEGVESLGEMQARLREALPKTQLAKLEALEATSAAAGKKVVLVEGLFDTGVTWKKILTPARQAKLRDILKNEGMAAPDIDRLVDGLVGRAGTVKVVFGTDPVRTAAPYGKLFAGMHTPPAGKIEVHHGDPLYLGGGHDPALLFGLPTKPHDALHAFFDNLTLPSSSSLGAVRLQPNVIQNAAKSRAKPAAAVVHPVTGDVEYHAFGKK